MMHTWLRWLPWVVALGLQGFPQSEMGRGTPRRGGTLRLAIESDQRTLDPIRIFSGHEGVFAALVHRSLLDYTAEGRFIPSVARALPEVSTDGRVLTFPLDPSARFANGRPVTAADVVYSLERCLDPAAGALGSVFFRSLRGAAAFENARRLELDQPGSRPKGSKGRWLEPRSVAGIVAVHDGSVRLELEHADLLFAHVLASPLSAVVPREEVERRGDRFGSAPIGCGPFVLQAWDRGVRMRFERHPYYHRPGEPYLDAVEVAVGVDFATQAMMLECGELDALSTLADADYVRFRRDPVLSSRVVSLAGVLPCYVALNCELPPFTNRQVRIALNHAVDKAAVHRALMGRGVVAHGVLAPSVRGFSDRLPEYRHDPVRARQLLAEAGLPEGFESELWVRREDPSFLKIALVVQENLRQVGVRVRIRDVNSSAFNDLTQTRRRVPMAVSDWGATFDDPRDTLDLLNGALRTDSGSLNIAFFSDPVLDRLFDRAAVEPEADRRLQLYQQIEAGLVEQAPWIFLLHFNDDKILQPWLKGFQHRPIWPNSRFERCWLER